MARHKDDGRGRMGGRAVGTKNKRTELKLTLLSHSQDYFNATIEVEDDNGNPTGKLISQFEVDMALLKPNDRVTAELTLLRYHTPQMQSTAIDMTVQDEEKTLTDRLTAISDGKKVSSNEE